MTAGKRPGSGRPVVPASDITHIVLAFDDNRLAGDLFGQFDQNLALIEQRLGIEVVARGNHGDDQGPARRLRDRSRHTWSRSISA